MKKQLLLLVLLLAAYSLFAADFRKVSWFMSKQQVIEAEGRSDYKETGPSPLCTSSIAYIVSIDGYWGILVYDFDDQGLVLAMYMFANITDIYGMIDHTEDGFSAYLRGSYNAVCKGIRSKYGEASESTESGLVWHLARTDIKVKRGEKDCTVYYVEKTLMNRKRQDNF